MRKAIIACAGYTGLMFLNSCGPGDRPATISTVYVKVPIASPCINPAAIPAKPAPLGARPDTVSAALDLALAKVLEWQGYGDRADAVLRGCLKD